MNLFLKGMLLLLLLLQFTLIQGQQKEIKVILDSQLDSMNVPAQDKDVLQALKIWELYIQTKNDSLLVGNPYELPDLKKNIDDQLFPKSFPAANTSFHVIGYEKTDEGYIMETVVQFVNKDWDVDYILSYFKIGAKMVNNQYKLFFLFDDYLKNLNKTETRFINYYTSPGIKPDPISIEKANKFCDSILKIFSINKNEKVNYILCEKERTYEVFGHYFYWGSANSRQFHIGERTFILDNKTNGNYYHELVHFLFNSFKCQSILNEGIATWLGGPTSYETYTDAVDSLRKKNYENKEVLNKMIKSLPPYYQPVYAYAISGIVMEYAYKKGGAELVKELLCDKSSDIFEILKNHFQIAHQSPEDFLIDLIKTK